MSEENLLPDQNGPKMAPIARIINVFISPDETFHSVKKKSSWLLPVILIVIMSIVTGIITAPIGQKIQMTQTEQSFREKGVPQEQQDQILKYFEKYGFAIYLVGIGFQAVMGVGVIAIFSLIMLFFANVVYKAQAKFLQLFELAALSWLIMTLGGLVKSPIIRFRETLDVQFGLAALTPSISKTSFLYSLLTQVDIFNIWTAAVFTLGFAIICSKKTYTVLPVVIPVWLIYFLGIAFMLFKSKVFAI
ncbi:YIP1 family protein [candidate division KSB1 bacterium]|nr:YIP1 family protein [candidate division KSB1 bacterium]